MHSSKRQMRDISRHVRKLFLWRNSTEHSEERNQLSVAAGMKFHYFRGQCLANIYFFPLDFPLYWHIFIIHSNRHNVDNFFPMCYVLDCIQPSSPYFVPPPPSSLLPGLFSSPVSLSLY